MKIKNLKLGSKIIGAMLVGGCASYAAGLCYESIPAKEGGGMVEWTSQTMPEDVALMIGMNGAMLTGVGAVVYTTMKKDAEEELKFNQRQKKL